MKKTFLLTIAFAFVCILGANYANAQTAEDANNEFNKARELSKTDLIAAVSQLEKALDMAKKVGETANPVKDEIVKVIANWQFNGAATYIKANNLAKAAQAYEKSLELAKLYGDKETEKSAKDQLVMVYIADGNDLLSKNATNEAFGAFDKALKINPEEAKVYLSRSQAYKATKDDAKMEADLEKAIELATKSNDLETATSAKKVLGVSYLNDSFSDLKAKKYQEVIDKASKSNEYTGGHAMAYYAIANASNALKKYNEAIEAANKGLELSKDQPDEKVARFYYELASAYFAKKDTENACANYKKANFGPYAQACKAQLTNLKCN